MGISAIDHWVIIVKDMDKSVAFYRKLGLKESWQSKAGRGVGPGPCSG